MRAALERELSGHADDAGLVRRVGERRQDLEAERPVEGCHVDHDAAAGLQVRPRGAGQVEDQVDLASPGAIPFVASDVLEPVEVRRGGEIEQDIDASVRA